MFTKITALRLEYTTLWFSSYCNFGRSTLAATNQSQTADSTENKHVRYFDFQVNLFSDFKSRLVYSSS